MVPCIRTVVCILLVAAWASPVRAQIVNPLRGFDDEERGWAGGVESTVAIADGNTEYFEFELSGAVQHQSERHRWRLLGRYQRRTASGVEIAESRMTHLRHNYRLLQWLSSLAFLQAQYEPFKRIETRLLAGAGARADLFEGVMWHTAVGAAVMLENEELTDTAGGATNDVRCSFFVSVFRDVKEGVDIDLVGFYQPRVDRPSDSRANIVGSLRVDIVGELYVVIRYNAEYDANPPAGVDELDQNFRAGLGYDF